MANTSYFSAENSWKRLFFITGKTADEFYMDSGTNLVETAQMVLTLLTE